MNVTFYLRNSRGDGKLRYTRKVSVDISRITHVEFVSNVSCRITVLDPPELTVGRPVCATSQHLIVGDRAFITSYIKRVAMQSQSPVRLRL